MVGNITFYDFCSFLSVAVNNMDELLFFLYLLYLEQQNMW